MANLLTEQRFIHYPAYGLITLADRAIEVSTYPIEISEQAKLDLAAGTTDEIVIQVIHWADTHPMVTIVAQTWDDQPPAAPTAEGDKTAGPLDLDCPTGYLIIASPTAGGTEVPLPQGPGTYAITCQQHHDPEQDTLTYTIRAWRTGTLPEAIEDDDF